MAAAGRCTVGACPPSRPATSAASRWAEGRAISRYVLVHGSWHGAWVWDRVRPLLVAGGHDVDAPDLPGRGDDPRPPEEITLDDHVDRVVDVLELGDRPAILVGHSFGGFVISHVAERRPELLELLVYLAAFLLRAGESVLEVARSVPPVVPHLDVQEPAGLIVVRADAARDAFYHDCSAEDADRATARLVPEALGPRRTPATITDERFGRVPRVYMETVHDRGLPLALQRRMQAALPCGEVVSLASGHSPFLSMSGTLARHLTRWGTPPRGPRTTDR
jgi:pimeloyl-ACP methyl ester carboxylesterase